MSPRTFGLASYHGGNSRNFWSARNSPCRVCAADVTDYVCSWTPPETVMSGVQFPTPEDETWTATPCGHEVPYETVHFVDIRYFASLGEARAHAEQDVS